MGFFQDIGSSFKIKTFYKKAIMNMDKNNIVSVFEEVITYGNMLEISKGTLDNIKEDLYTTFIRKINRLDGIADPTRERLLSELHNAYIKLKG